MTSNGAPKGRCGSSASREKQMRAYDALPRSIRNALANAVFSWAPFPIQKRFERGEFSANTWCALISMWDRQHIRADRKRVWGIK